MASEGRPSAKPLEVQEPKQQPPKTPTPEIQHPKAHAPKAQPSEAEPWKPQYSTTQPPTAQQPSQRAPKNIHSKSGFAGSKVLPMKSTYIVFLKKYALFSTNLLKICCANLPTVDQSFQGKNSKICF